MNDDDSIERRIIIYPWTLHRLERIHHSLVGGMIKDPT